MIYILYLLLCSFGTTVNAEAQFFNTLSSGKRFFTGSGSNHGRLIQRNDGSGYGAPPTNKPSYNAKPSYNNNNAKPSYGSTGNNIKTIQIPVPNFNIPNPIDFKAGVLRSKGRIASGLLHAKAGILRAGANILAQKADALDRVAQAIPGMKAKLINQLKQFGGGYGGGGYGATPSSTPSYNAPAPSYNAPSPGYGAPIGPVMNSFTPSPNDMNILANTNNNNNNNNNNNIPISSTITFGQQQDDYGSPLGNPITSNGNLFNNNNNNNNPFINNNNNNNNFVNNNNNNVVNSNTYSPNNVQQTSNMVISTTGVDPGLTSDNFVFQETRQPLSQLTDVCKSRGALENLLEDIFMGHELLPDVLDEAPLYPLDLSYKTIRTYPGMRVTADMTRFKPMLHWPYDPNTFYTIVVSNLDINSRRNRTLSEFWHWFVANIPGDSVDDGEVIFELLFPLVLPEGDGDHRFGYFVFKQPSRLDYKEEGRTDNCSPTMSNGRGPFKSTKNFQKKYNLELTASTFLIVDYNEASMDIACEWQKCIGDTINLVSPLRCG